MIRIDGRKEYGTTACFVPTAGGLFIRIDLESDPDFWCEITIPETDLLPMLAKIHGLAHTSPNRDQAESREAKQAESR